MKKFTKIAAVLAALVLALSFFAGCKNDDGGGEHWSYDVNQSEWEKAFTFEGYSSEIYITTYYDEFGGDNSSRKLLINGEDFKLNIYDRYSDVEGLLYSSNEYFAKKDGKLYYSKNSVTEFSEADENNWSSTLPKNAKEMFSCILGEFGITSLKDKYNDFEYSSGDRSYKKTYSEYGEGEYKLTDVDVKVQFKNNKKLQAVEINGTTSKNTKIGITAYITDSTNAPPDGPDYTVDFTVDTTTHNVNMYKYEY